MKRLLTLLTVLMFSFATLTTTHASTYRQVPAKHLKKDGTPDKRFKENKPPKGPLKKDGTADMRFKANKPAPKPAPPAPKPPAKTKKK